MGGDEGGGGGKGGGDSKGGGGGSDYGSSGSYGSGSAGTAGYIGPQYDSNFNVIGPAPSSSGSAGAPMNILPDVAQTSPSPVGSFTPSTSGSSAAGASVATEPGFASGFSSGAFDQSGGFQPTPSPASFQPGETVPTPAPRPASAPSATPAVDASGTGLAPGETVPIPQPRPADAPGATPTGVSTSPTTSLAQPQGLTAPSGTSATAAPTGASAGDMSSSGSSKKESGGLSMGDIVTPKNALAAAGMGFNLFQSAKASQGIPSTSQMSQEIQKQASQLNEQGKQLASYLQSGTLPDGLKTQLTQATAAAKARLISNYAAQGMPTDPRKNSALAQQLGMIDQQAIITTAQIGQQLLSQGVQESGMASDLYTKLVNIDQTQTARIGQAISQMSAALNGAPKTVQVNLPT